MSWTHLGNAGTGRHTHVVFGNVTFAASGDDNLTVTSSDGTNWKTLNGIGNVAFCNNQFAENQSCFGDQYAAGSWIVGSWLRDSNGKIQRSTDGKAWQDAYSENTNSVDAIAFGWAPP